MPAAQKKKYMIDFDAMPPQPKQINLERLLLKICLWKMLSLISIGTLSSRLGNCAAVIQTAAIQRYSMMRSRWRSKKVFDEAQEMLNEIVKKSMWLKGVVGLFQRIVLIMEKMWRSTRATRIAQSRRYISHASATGGKDDEPYFSQADFVAPGKNDYLGMFAVSC